MLPVRPTLDLLPAWVVLVLLAVCPTARALVDRSYNVLLITLDTTRADYVSINGSTHVKTPHIDRLARGGVNFTRARSPVPMTLPAHASILTASYPPRHGLRDNGAYRLPEGQTTLAEILKERGYETAAFIGAFVLDHRFGLAQGFDVYDDRTWSSVEMLENLEAERDANAVYGAFSNWLEGYSGDNPFFAWVHLYDPHAPYTPPEPYRSRYAANPYAGEVACADAVVGKLVARLEDRRLLGHTLIALVGDHGEGLGDHEEKTHALLIYNSTLHVPMLIHAPGLIPAATTLARLSRIIDLAPTLLDYLGIRRRLGQGRSLRPWIEGKASAEREVAAYSESLYPKLHVGWSELRGLESGRYRFILAPSRELYDLEADPAEKNNLIDAAPEVGRRLERELKAMVAKMEKKKSESRRTIDAETEAMLASLGYASGGGSGSALSSAVDPKDKMDVWDQIQLGIFQFGGGDYRGALGTFSGLLEDEKDIPLLYEYAGSCYMRLERYGEAERVYREALRRGVDSADVHLNLGLIHFYRREATEAERELKAALEANELDVSAHYRLADVYRAARNYEPAVEHYRRALAVNPSYVYAWNGLGMTLASMRRGAEALEAFSKAVEIDPAGARGYFNLAVLLERMHRKGEALEAYRKFMKLCPEGELARERGRAAAAIRRLESEPR